MDEQVNDKYVKKIFILFLFVIFFAVTCNSQQIGLMPADGLWYTWTVDDAFLYDDGYTSDYKNDGLGALTIYPTAGYTSIEFLVFDVEYEPSACGWDYLEVYHGETFDSLIGRYCGTTPPPIIKSTHPTGALTLLWSSDMTVSRSGFILSIQTQAGALPIELVSFNASLVEDAVSIDWIVASEINNNFFTVERSKDAYDWSELTRIPGLGNHNNEVSYHCMDVSPYSGISYYRLKQTDYDGKYKIFRPVTVIIDRGLYVVKTINIFGQVVTEDYKGLVIDIYNNNTTKKRWQHE